MKKSKIKKFETDIPLVCLCVGLMVGSLISIILDNVVLVAIGEGIGASIGVIYNSCQKLKKYKNKESE